MIEPNNPILTRMLDRLFAAMLNGPSMNCRPHASRQRLDLVQLGKLRDIEPGAILMHVCAHEITVLAVEEETLIGGELEPAETERRGELIRHFPAVEHRGLHGI